MNKKQVYYDDSSKHNLTGGRWVYVDENGVPLSREELDNYDLSNPIYYSDPSQNPRQGNEFKGDDTQNEEALSAHVSNVRKGQNNLQRVRNQTLDVARLVPFVGDALDLGSAANDISKGKYLAAGTTLGLMFLPDILAKPIQKGIKLMKSSIKKFPDIGKIYPSENLPPELSELERKRQKTSFFLQNQRNFEDPKKKIPEEVLNNMNIVPINLTSGPIKEYKDILAHRYDLKYPDIQTYAITSDLLPNNVNGAYFQQNGTNYAVISMKYPLDGDETYVHEAISHATDNIIKNRISPTTPIFKQIWNRIRGKNIELVQDSYRKLSQPNPSYDGYLTPHSHEWVEARATNNQLRYNLFKDNINVDNLSNEDLMQRLSWTNGYGEDYSNYYRNLSPKDRKKYVKRWRKALKYLPIASAPIIIDTNEQTL